MIISPQALSRFNRMSGSMETPRGRVSVSYERKNGGVRFAINIPQQSKAVLRVFGADYALTEGEKMLLDIFRLVPEENKQMVVEMIRAALKTKG